MIAPLVDFTFLWSLLVSGLDLIEHHDQFDAPTLQKILVYYFAFLVVDLGSAALALVMERNEKKTLLPWLVLQRFGYRQLMYYIVIKASLAALLGPWVGWAKIERKATVGGTA